MKLIACVFYVLSVMSVLAQGTVSWTQSITNGDRFPTIMPFTATPGAMGAATNTTSIIGIGYWEEFLTNGVYELRWKEIEVKNPATEIKLTQIGSPNIYIWCAAPVSWAGFDSTNATALFNFKWQGIMVDNRPFDIFEPFYPAGAWPCHLSGWEVQVDLGSDGWVAKDIVASSGFSAWAMRMLDKQIRADKSGKVYSDRPQGFGSPEYTSRVYGWGEGNDRFHSIHQIWTNYGAPEIINVEIQPFMLGESNSTSSAGSYIVHQWHDGGLEGFVSFEVGDSNHIAGYLFIGVDDTNRVPVMAQ